MTTATSFPVRPASARAALPAYRLTRRGRWAVLMVALVGALVLGVLLSSVSAANETPESTQVMVVDAGDTLWAIASEHAEVGGVRDMIFHLQDLNDLDSSRLYAGQRLRVPA